MKRLIISLIGLSLLALLGCQKESIAPVNDQMANDQAIQNVLADSLDLSFTAIDDGTEENILSDDPSWLGSSLGKTSVIKTRFGRIGQQSVAKEVQIVYNSDSTATAYIYTKFEGIFIVRKVELKHDTLTIQNFEKPLTHEIERIVQLKKFRNDEDSRRKWKVVNISLANGKSPNNTVEIMELKIMAAGIDTVVITDPLAYFQNKTNLFTYPRLTDITVQVRVKNTSAEPVIFPDGTEATEHVRLHYGRNLLGHFARKPLQWIGKDDLGNNIYEGEWVVREFRGLHHAVIDVIDNGTILNPDAVAYPYNSNTWSSPYRVSIF